MAINLYSVPSLVRLSVAFTLLADGSPVDPSDVSLIVVAPGRERLIYDGVAIYRDGDGLYHYDLTVDRCGSWSYRWKGSGAVVAATPSVTFVAN